MRRAFATAATTGLIALAAGCTCEDSPRATASIRLSSVRPAETKPAQSETERARAAQAKQCAQRHLDRVNGMLKETPEQKRDRDEICAAYYRGS